MSVLEHSPPQGVEPDLMSIELRLNHSKLFRGECNSTISESEKTCTRIQNVDSKQLEQRVRDIMFVQKELKLKLEEITQSIDVLAGLQSRVVKALEGTKEPLRVTVLCVEERMKRPLSERRHDEVDRELVKEREVIEGVASLLQRVMEQITEQIRLNRSAKYHLEKDLKEKSEAQCMENSCALKTTLALNTLQTSRSTGLPSLAVTPNQWENISDLNMAKAEHQSSNSQSLRALVESVLEQTAADMQKQVQATTAAFQLNIQEIKSAKSHMEEKIPKILSEITNQQRTREDLQAAITQNQNFLSLAQARLYTEPVAVQCHNPAQSQLLTEVQQLVAHIKKLREEVIQSEKEQRELVRCQLELQETINIKADSLYIDEVKCSQHREPIIIRNF